MELYPYLKVTINEDDLTLRLQCMHTHPVGLIVSRPWFSHSHCAHIKTTGSHMLSIVDTWGCIQHFFKSCIAILTIGSCSVSLTRMHWHLVPPQKIMQSYTKNYHNINHARQSFSQQGFVPNCLMTAYLIATDDVYTPPVSPKRFPLK
jgi:hypothetical protein